MHYPMRLKLIACEILFREFSSLAARSTNTIDPVFLTKGLHDVGRERMRNALDEAISAVDERNYDAILLGYALCNGGVVDLEARTIPIVIPRAHDCITLFLGNRHEYLDYFYANPGTYFKTTGWIERGNDLLQSGPPGSEYDGTLGSLGMHQTFDELVAKYGRDNAEYLWNELRQMPHYSKLTFIETGVEPDDRFEQETRRLAEERGWEFEKLVGNLDLLRRLLDGDWNDEDFLVLKPGQSIRFDYTDAIITSAPVMEKQDQPAS